MTRDAELRSPTRAWILALGDAAAIVLFVIIGLTNHDEGITLKGMARTAVPILGAWFALAPFTKTYARPGLRSLLATWALAVPAGVAIRAAFLRRSADASQLTFLVVATITTLALLLSWRALLALLARRTPSDVRR